MPLKKFAEFKHRQSGVYVISPQPPEDETIMLKIGRTIQMNTRLNGFHLCFPNFFYLYKALMLNDTYHTRTAEDKKRTLNKTVELEKYVHDYLEKFRYESSTRTKHEWFSFSSDLSEVDEALVACHQHFKNDTDYPIKRFSKDGFFDRYYIDGVEEIKAAKRELKIVKEPPSYIGGRKETEETTTRKSTRVKKLPKKFKDSVFFDISKKTKKDWS